MEGRSKRRGEKKSEKNLVMEEVRTKEFRHKCPNLCLHIWWLAWSTLLHREHGIDPNRQPSLPPSVPLRDLHPTLIYISAHLYTYLPFR